MFEQGQADLQVSELFLSIQVKKKVPEILLSTSPSGDKDGLLGAPVLMVPDTEEEGVGTAN